MRAGANGVLFGRQPEGVPSHRVQHLRAGHAPVTADDVGGRVSLGMAHMQAVTGGVGEHVEDIELVASGFERAGVKGLVLVPVGLPVGLDTGGVVTGHGLSRVEWARGQMVRPSGEHCRIGRERTRGAIVY